MEYNFSKKDIKISLLNEGNDYKVFKKKSLVLKEEDANGVNQYSQNPQELTKNVARYGEATIPADNTQGGTQDDEITLDVHVPKGSSDVQSAVNKLKPVTDKIKNATGNEAMLHVTSEGRKNTIKLTKSELNEMFKK